jgi:hypothetical protein
MMRAGLLITTRLLIVCAFVLLAIDAVEARTPQTTQSVRFTRCLNGAELHKSLDALKLQGGDTVYKAAESLLTKARTVPGCRTQIVQALISSMALATDPAANKYENYFLWLHGASILADLKATEALDLLITNLNLSDGWSTSISEAHVPVLVAVLKIGLPAIPKLQIVLSSDPQAYRRNFAALAIAYIGGTQARRALTNALPGESDPCVKNFLRISLQAFDNKAKPNHVSSALNGKWLSAFYCR